MSTVKFLTIISPQSSDYSMQFADIPVSRFLQGQLITDMQSVIQACRHWKDHTVLYSTCYRKSLPKSITRFQDWVSSTTLAEQCLWLMYLAEERIIDAAKTEKQLVTCTGCNWSSIDMRSGISIDTSCGHALKTVTTQVKLQKWTRC